MDQHVDASPNPGLIEVSAPDGGPVLVPAPSTVLLRVSDDPRRVDAWALALLSKGVQPVLLWADGAFELRVAYADFGVAQAELDAMDAEERAARRASLEATESKEPAGSRHAGLGAVLMAALLLAFFAVTGPRAESSAWFAHGAADAERILQGEWWRAITALTLHADGAHVLSNVGLGTLVVGAVMRSEGVGWGAALVVAAGSAGNLINAWAHQSLHRSVGFSTAVFGAIGILAGLAYVHGRRRVNRSRPAWTALGVGVALLAFLGTGGARTDLFAHLFGGLAGVALGLLCALTGWRPTTAKGQWSAGAAALASLVGAWWLALS